MKNRTVIGVICMVAAIAVTFLVAPIVNRLSSDTSEVIRLSEDVKQGARITADHLEVVPVKTDSIPEGVLSDPDEIIGKYTSTALFAGDYLTAAKLTGEPN
ncbi:MAG: SAF domain-containing protein, partial [Clostridia bacterium]|nr:SAF domain-containing protein [Clostridia bacterium]